MNYGKKYLSHFKFEVLMETVDQEYHKMWKISVPTQEEVVEICDECEKKSYIITTLEEELIYERKAMDETILSVEKMEAEHKNKIENLNTLLNIEKDKVIALQKTNDMERKARMEDIYKFEKQSRNFEFITRDYERVQVKNSQLLEEIETLRNENISYSGSVSQALASKESLMIELRKYENQLAEFETTNTALRMRLHRAENDRDTYFGLNLKLQRKLDLSLRGLVAPPSLRGRRKAPPPLLPSDQSVSGPNHSEASVGDMTSIHSMSSVGGYPSPSTGANSRASELSYVRLVKEYHEKTGVMKSHKNMDFLWPVKL